MAERWVWMSWLHWLSHEHITFYSDHKIHFISPDPPTTAPKPWPQTMATKLWPPNYDLQNLDPKLQPSSVTP